MGNCERGRRRKHLKKRLMTLPLKFLLLQLVLPVSDTVTDVLAGHSYYDQGHVYWASSIWLLMAGPLVLKTLVEMLKLIGKCSRKSRPTNESRIQEEHELSSLNERERSHHSEDPERNELGGQTSIVSRIGTDAIMEYAAAIPLLQPFVHLHFAYKLHEAAFEMEEAKEKYYVVEREVKNCKRRGVEPDKCLGDDVKSLAKDYLKSRQTYCRLLTIFQGIRLYEVFGESGPQAVLQMSIAFRIGYTDYLQVLGIVFSIVSLASGAAQTLLLKGTKRNEIKEESWRHTWLIFFPIMAGLTVPRLLALALITSYAKVYAILFIILMIFVGLLVNLYPYAKRDPAGALLGVVTNLFGPCIVIDEGSKFLIKSSISATVLHSLNLVIFISLVLSGSSFTPKENDNPPLIHCFGNNSATNSTFSRCLFNSSELTNCAEGLVLNEREGSYSTYCNNMKWWLPLLVTTSTIMALLILTIPLTVLINWLLDPIALTIASRCCLRCCFPGSYLPPIWNEHKEFESPVFGILNSNDSIDDSFKERSITDLPEDKKYEHMCTPTCTSLQLKLEKFTGMLHISKSPSENMLDSEAGGEKDGRVGDEIVVNQDRNEDLQEGLEKSNETDGLAVDEIVVNQDKNEDLQDGTELRGRMDLREGHGDVELGSTEPLSRVGDIPHKSEMPTDAKSFHSRTDSYESLVYDSSGEAEPEDKVTVNHTGMDIINWAIDKDCHLLLKNILEMKKISVDKAMLNRACTVVNGKAIGSPKTISFLLERILQQPSVMETFGIQTEYLEQFQVERYFVAGFKDQLSKARKQPDSAKVIEALNHITALSGGTNIGDEILNEVYLLQIALNIPMERATDLCDALGLEDSSATWFLRNPSRTYVAKETFRPETQPYDTSPYLSIEVGSQVATCK